MLLLVASDITIHSEITQGNKTDFSSGKTLSTVVSRIPLRATYKHSGRNAIDSVDRKNASFGTVFQSIKASHPYIQKKIDTKYYNIKDVLESSNLSEIKDDKIDIYESDHAIRKEGGDSAVYSRNEDNDLLPVNNDTIHKRTKTESTYVNSIININDFVLQTKTGMIDGVTYNSIDAKNSRDSMDNEVHDFDPPMLDENEEVKASSVAPKVFSRRIRSKRDICQSLSSRSLCPWNYSIITNNTMLPRKIQVATCNSSLPTRSSDPNIRCENITILKQMKIIDCAGTNCHELVEVPVGCTPAYRCHRIPPV